MPPPVAKKSNENDSDSSSSEQSQTKNKSSRRGNRGGGNSGQSKSSKSASEAPAKDQSRENRSGGSGDSAGDAGSPGSKSQKRRGRRRRNKKPNNRPVEAIVGDAIELDEAQLEARRGESRNGEPLGRYSMIVSKRPDGAHIAILEGRNLIEYYVSRPNDDEFQIHGNIYLGKVKNILPGMEAAFVDIGTPKNAVIYRGDVAIGAEDTDAKPVRRKDKPKIEDALHNGQQVICQVSKNPIAHKGARLTTEVSLPGRFVVLVPNSNTYGISKRLPDKERKRLRQILDRVKPKEHGVIVRTAAENITAAEIERDVLALAEQWKQIEALAKRSNRPTKLYQEPELSTRVIREEFNKDYRAVLIDHPEMFADVKDYVESITPALAERVKHYDLTTEALPLFERYHVHEQLHKALERSVWLPSGGSLVIESTEALWVIDVNTGKNVGSSSLEETVFHNNMEAAVEIARQVRLRDMGGIIVIDFVDMEDRKNREEVINTFRQALRRDKTRTQVFDISELGLAQMTRKRIGEGLVESLSEKCVHCEGRGLIVDPSATASESVSSKGGRK
ncbi:MAG: Rne/Rng family ribonuclease [Acidimicrobiales bacterium]|nr:Rne/Rng family ribonuclease [Acidimicrobiales bacterium]